MFLTKEKRVRFCFNMFKIVFKELYLLYNCYNLRLHALNE